MSNKNFRITILFTFTILLISIFYLRSVFADWKSDTDPPTTTIYATGTGCLPDGPNAIKCPNTTTVNIQVCCTDLDSGCNSIFASKTSNIPPYSPSYSPPCVSPFKDNVTFADGSPVNVNAYSIDNAGNSAGTSALQTTETIIFTYTVSGYIYEDKNLSNTRDAGDTDYTGAITVDAKVNLGDPTPVATYSCPPSCTGLYTLSLPPGSYYYIIYTPPTGYTRQYPPLGSFRVRVGTSPPCNTGGSNQATCPDGNISNLNFGMTKSYPWYQCIGADCRDDDGTKDPLPTSDATNCGGADYPSRYASIPGPASGMSQTPGVMYSGNTNPSFGLGSVSQNPPWGWTVGDATYPELFTPVRPGIIRTSYNYYQTTLKQNGITPSPIAPGNLPAGLSHGVYQVEGNLTIPSGTYTFGNRQNYVILVHGNLNINGNVLVPNGSTVTFSASGDINVDGNVGVLSSTTVCVLSQVLDGISVGCNIEGFYSTDGSFIINKRASDSCAASQASLRLNIAGSVVVNASLNGGSIQSNRDLCDGNAQCPTFTATERPDFLLNAPDFIKHPNFIWQEVTP